MSRILCIWKKELRSYFTSATGYAFLFLFLLLTSFLFFVLPSVDLKSGFRGNFFLQGEATLTDYFATFPVALGLFVPILCIRLWPEEYKTGTVEVLMTLPVRASDVVIGKFLAMVTIVATALGLSLVVPCTVGWVAVDGLDAGPIIGGYVGALLLGGAYCAVAMFATAFTKEQVTGLLVALVICFFLTFAGTAAVDLVTPDWLSERLKFIGFSVRFSSIEKGVLDFRDLFFFFSFTAMFAFLNVSVLEYRRLK